MPQSPDDGFLDQGRAVILEIVESQRCEVHRRAGEEIRRLEERRDRDLRQLNEVAGVLTPEGRVPSAASAPKMTPSIRRPAKRRRKAKRQSASQKAREAREAIQRFLGEAVEPTSSGEIRSALGLSEHTTANALKRLMADEVVGKQGTGPHTRYLLKSGRAPSSADQLASGTTQGTILAILEDRGSASADELAQALRIPVERVREECGALIDEDEIRMSGRGGAPVYIRLRAAA